MKPLLRSSVIGLFALLATAGLCPAQDAEALRGQVQGKVDAGYGQLDALYKHLHANPELSFHEVKTSAKLAGELKQLGYEVTEKVGGHGVVAVLRNGAGPTVLVRADMDALPVKEQTGLPYASKVTTTDDKGHEVSVMHACGHDVHMTCLVGVARVLGQLKAHWQGTLVLIGQPAEERIGGAKAMLADGLFTRFPKPNYCLALHVASDFPAGSIGYTEGFALANSDFVDIVVRGLGGHGAMPNKTKDPVVLAAQIVLALQTIVSREIEPTEPAVVTVGSIHGGTKHNIIPDEVHLQLTIRSYSDAVRGQTVAAIERIVRGQALSAGIPEDRLPTVTVGEGGAKATYNDPALAQRMAGVFAAWLGPDKVLKRKPTMGAEDFGMYGRTEDKIPILMFWLGSVDAKRVADSQRGGAPLPGLHSPLFYPLPEPTIKTGVLTMTAAVLELMGKR